MMALLKFSAVFKQYRWRFSALVVTSLLSAAALVLSGFFGATPAAKAAVNWTTPATQFGGGSTGKPPMFDMAMTYRSTDGAAFMFGSTGSEGISTGLGDQQLWISNNINFGAKSVSTQVNGFKYARATTGPGNRMYVTYRDNYSGGGGYRASFRYIDTNGTNITVGPLVDIGNKFNLGASLDIADIFYKDGRIHLVANYKARTSTSFGSWVYMESTDEFNTIVNYTTLLSDQPLIEIRPRLCVSPNGNIHTVGIWGTDIRVRSRVNGAWTVNTKLASGNSSNQTNRSHPRVVCAADNTAYAEWDNGENNDSTTSLAVARFSTSINSWVVTNTNLAPDNNGARQGYDIAVGPDNRVYTAFGVWSIAGVTQNPSPVKVYVSNDQGVTWNFDSQPISHPGDVIPANLLFVPPAGKFYLAATVNIGNGVNDSSTRRSFFTSAPALLRPKFLAFTTQPTSVGAGATINPAPAVAVYDETGALYSPYAGSLKLELLGPDGNLLSGVLNPATPIANVVNGVATFSGISLGYPGPGFKLRASVNSGEALLEPTNPLRDSSAFDVTGKFIFSSQPTNIGTNVNFAPAIQIQAARPDNVPLTNIPSSLLQYASVFLGIAPGTGSPLASLSNGGSQTVNAATGIATYNTSLNYFGTGFQLQAYAGTPSLYAGAVSVAFDVTASLSVTTPGNIFDDSSFAITATVRDGNSNILTSFNGPVDITSFNTNLAGLILNGPDRVYARQGVATFFPLSVSRPSNSQNVSVTLQISDDLKANTGNFQVLLYTDSAGINGAHPDNCNRLLVNSVGNDIANDPSDTTNCRITLRHAVNYYNSLSSSDKNTYNLVRFVFGVNTDKVKNISPNAGSITIDLASTANGATPGSVTIPDGLNLDAGCAGGPGVNIKSTTGAHVKVSGDNYLRGLNILQTDPYYAMFELINNAKQVRVQCSKTSR